MSCRVTMLLMMLVMGELKRKENPNPDLRAHSCLFTSSGGKRVLLGETTSSKGPPEVGHCVFCPGTNKLDHVEIVSWPQWKRVITT